MTETFDVDMATMDMATLVAGLAGLSVGLILGAVAMAAYFRPVLVVAAVRSVAVVLLALGVGLLVWGIVSLSLGESVSSPIQGTQLFRTASECIAWGAGLLTGGIVTLVFGFIGPPRTHR